MTSYDNEKKLANKDHSSSSGRGRGRGQWRGHGRDVVLVVEVVEVNSRINILTRSGNVRMIKMRKKKVRLLLVTVVE